MAEEASEAEAWKDSLESIRETIEEAAGAVNQLRATLQELAPVWRSLSQLEEALRNAARSEIAARPVGEGPVADASGTGAVTAEAPQFEPAEAAKAAPTSEAAAAAPPRLARPLVEARATRPAEGRAGVYTCTITVEDTRRRVDLVPLHRALRSVPGVRDMSLLAYTNGIATIALDSRSSLEAPALRAAIEETIGRECKIWERSPDSFLVTVGA